MGFFKKIFNGLKKTKDAIASKISLIFTGTIDDEFYEELEDILISTKSDYDSRDDKYIYYYLKKAKQQYKKSQKDSSDSSLECAQEAIENATIAYRYTLPYLKNELKGTWIRPSEKSISEIQKKLDKIKNTGINNIFLLSS